MTTVVNIILDEFPQGATENFYWPSYPNPQGKKDDKKLPTEEVCKHDCWLPLIILTLDARSGHSGRSSWYPSPQIMPTPGCWPYHHGQTSCPNLTAPRVSHETRAAINNIIQKRNTIYKHNTRMPRSLERVYTTQMGIGLRRILERPVLWRMARDIIPNEIGRCQT